MARADSIVASFRSVIAPRSRVLDIGAGDGQVARELDREFGARVTMVDVVHYSRSNLTLVLSDSRALAFADESFDYAILSFVLHHSPNPDVILNEALRVSRQVLVIENDVPGHLRGALTRLVDSAPNLRYGTPPCYLTRSRAGWFEWFEQFPIRAHLLHEFSLGLFGFFRCFSVHLCKA